jgi:hypothetical protein
MRWQTLMVAGIISKDAWKTEAIQGEKATIANAIHLKYKQIKQPLIISCKGLFLYTLSRIRQSETAYKARMKVVNRGNIEDAKVLVECKGRKYNEIQPTGSLVCRLYEEGYR